MRHSQEEAFSIKKKVGSNIILRNMIYENFVRLKKKKKKAFKIENSFRNVFSFFHRIWRNIIWEYRDR